MKLAALKFVHSKKMNFAEPKGCEGTYEAISKAYARETQFLSLLPASNDAVLRLISNSVSKHPEWNTLVLFDFTKQGESLFGMFRCRRPASRNFL